MVVQAVKAQTSEDKEPTLRYPTFPPFCNILNPHNGSQAFAG